MVLIHGGFTFPCGKKREDGEDSVDGHASRTLRAQGSLGGWIPVQAAREGAAREARPGLSWPHDGSLRQWVLLARPRLPERADSGEQQLILARKILQEPCKGRPKCAAPATIRLVGSYGLGMLPVIGSRPRNGDSEVACHLGAKARGNVLVSPFALASIKLPLAWGELVTWYASLRCRLRLRDHAPSLSIARRLWH